MNSLLFSSSDDNDREQLLKERKGSFFFRLERELEKVNLFYLQKESELKIRLDILIEKKQELFAQGRLDNNKNSVAYISLYEGFKKFSKDLERLEQFVELNEVGFTKVLKKWDKRSKSQTKELYLTTAVNVQPVFHRDEIIELSDLVANNLLELEAKAEGESIVRYTKAKLKDQVGDEQITPVDTGDKAVDELYNEFVLKATTQPLVGSLEDGIHEWCDLLHRESSKKAIDLTKLFLLLIANVKITDTTIRIFYDYFKREIDLSKPDDLNGRNCLHEAAATAKDASTNVDLTASASANTRLFIVDLALEAHVDIATKDSSGKTPLHYAIETNRNDIVLKLAPQLQQHTVDIRDNDSMTPLLMAIANQNTECVQVLLDHGANPLPPQDPNSPSYLPLNVACKVGNTEIVRLILDKAVTAKSTTTTSRREIFQPNAEGLLPLHIVANFGHYQLVPLLIQYGAKVNQLDKLNKWSPIFYSATEGYTKTTMLLIGSGADFKLKDEEGLTPLYYAAWEGNVGVLNVFIELLSKEVDHVNHASFSDIDRTTVSNGDIVSPMLAKSSALNPEVPNLELIPDLSLPPPILPLRKYGHNFLEKRIFVKLNFYTNRDSIKLYDHQFLSSIPGRITINCAQNDIIPRSLLLPISDDEKTITFQVDSLENFSIDFELFPTFGTRLIAKSTLLSSAFANATNRSCYKSSDMNHNINMIGDLCIPLFDVRLRNLGELSFNYQIIYPYSGIPLEISQYDTYWKSTNNNGSSNAVATTTTTKSTYFSFVTDSSLSGEYYRVNICSLSDGTPIVCPSWKIQVGGLEIPLFNLNVAQLNQLISPLDQQNLLIALGGMKNLIEKSNSSQVEEIFKNLYTPLELFLKELPLEVSLDLEIFYPSLYEDNFCNLQMSKTATGLFSNNMNNFIDSILTNVFDHVRSIRNSGTQTKTRSVIFSSANSTACTILNWKQPNYPVFYIMNGMNFQSNSKKFVATSANGFPISTDVIDQIKTKQLKKQLKTSSMLNNFQSETGDGTGNNNKHQMNIDNIDSINKKSSSYNNELLYQDLITRSVKLGVNFVTQNNLLGIIVPNKLLKLCPSLIKTIRSRGLILVASKDDTTTDGQQDLMEQDEEVMETDDKEFIHSIMEIYDQDAESDGEVNGLRFNDILSFKDAIDM